MTGVVGIKAVCCAFLLLQVAGHFVVHGRDAVSDSAGTLTASRVKELCAKTLFIHCLNNLIMHSMSVLHHSHQHMCYVLFTGFSFLKRSRQELLLKQPVQSLNCFFPRSV